jgi:hypothetical protein
VVSLISLFSWALPFASLLKAFAGPLHAALAPRAAWRTTLYRVWVIPVGLTLFFLTDWGLPTNPPPIVFELMFLFFLFLPRILIVVHCHAMARYCGATGGSALLVALVPQGVEWASGLWVWHVARSLLPPMEAAAALGSGG